MSFESQEFDDWEVGPKYKIQQILGSGSYGCVAKAIQQETGRTVAIKRIDDIFDHPEISKRILREVTLLRKLRHPCVVEFIELIIPESLEEFNTIYVVQEFVSFDLRQLIRGDQTINLKHVKAIIYNLLIGLMYCHNSQVIHRDIKPANILVSNDCSIKICDFGLARSLGGIKTDRLSIGSAVSHTFDTPLKYSDSIIKMQKDCEIRFKDYFRLPMYDSCLENDDVKIQDTDDELIFQTNYCKYGKLSELTKTYESKISF